MSEELEYLLQVLNDGDSKELMRALGYVAKAKGMMLITAPPSKNTKAHQSLAV